MDRERELLRHAAGVRRRLEAGRRFARGRRWRSSGRRQSQPGMVILVDAMAPTNFLLSNPAALIRAVQTGGRSVTAGDQPAPLEHPEPLREQGATYPGMPRWISLNPRAPIVSSRMTSVSTGRRARRRRSRSGSSRFRTYLPVSNQGRNGLERIWHARRWGTAKTQPGILECAFPSVVGTARKVGPSTLQGGV